MDDGNTDHLLQVCKHGLPPHCLELIPGLAVSYLSGSQCPLCLFPENAMRVLKKKNPLLYRILSYK